MPQVRYVYLVCAVCAIMAGCGGSGDVAPTNVTDAGPAPTAETLSAPALDVADVPGENVVNPAAEAFVLTSPAFRDGDKIPAKHTGEGEDVSPELAWSSPPDGTKSYVLIMDDPDAPRGTWVHWVVYGIPAATTGLPEGVAHGGAVPGGGTQGVNDFKNQGYNGPMPPPGDPHRYYFKLYAVDFEPDIQPGQTKDDVLKAIEGHALGQAQLMGTYQRTESGR